MLFLCYSGSTVAQRKSMARAARPGVTEKISVSVDREDLAVLRRRARKLYEGNLSAAVGEGVRHIREQEGREALVRWLGAAGKVTDTQREALRAEWRGASVRHRRASRQG